MEAVSEGKYKSSDKQQITYFPPLSHYLFIWRKEKKKKLTPLDELIVRPL